MYKFEGLNFSLKWSYQFNFSFRSISADDKCWNRFVNERFCHFPWKYNFKKLSLIQIWIKWHMNVRFSFKSEVNSPAKVMTLRAMKNNLSSAINSVRVDTIWFDRLLMSTRKKRGHEIDPCGVPKKTKQNKIRRCKSYILTFSLFYCSWSYSYIAQDLKYKFSKNSTL